jgi:uncharacterized protein (TIGR02453 family)
MTPVFTSESLKFLRGLARNNHRDWFEDRRSLYEGAVKQPMLALIEAVNERVARFAPEHVRSPQKTMLRIYRDTRFSQDKRPYKLHASAWWGRVGSPRTGGAGFYLQIKPAETLFAAGVYMPTREELLTVRRWMADHHAAYRKMLTRLSKPTKTAPRFEPEDDSNALQRMPKGFAKDHPADELLRASRWGVSGTMPEDVIFTPDFADRVARVFERCAPLLLALDEACGAKRRPSRPLF